MIQVTPVILCGGSGSRLWPLSRTGFPKQFLCLTGNESLFKRAKAQVTAQEVKVGAMHGYLAETVTDFKYAMTELAKLRAQLAKQEKDEPVTAAGQVYYVAKFREFKYQETLFELFARQFEMFKVDESREGAVIQVLDTAQPPERKSKPKKTLIATLAAGFALLPFVFIRQALRNGTKS